MRPAIVGGAVEAGLCQTDLALSCYEIPYVYLGARKKDAPSPVCLLKAAEASDEPSRLIWLSDGGPLPDES